MKLYVKNTIRTPNDTLYTFLCKLFKFNNDAFCKGTVETTYFDPEFTNPQCIMGKYRSFDEIILISKTCFRVSNKAVAKVIKRLLDEVGLTSLVFCDTANKWVFYYGLSRSESVKYCALYRKSYEKTGQPGSGVHSFDDIITLMGLTKEDVKIKNG